MYRQLKLLNIAATFTQVRINMPVKMKELYPYLREIYVATEIEAQRSRDPIAQRLMWSHYKQRHTLKVPIGCGPVGNITCISDVYGGSVSDKQLFINSGVV